MGGICAYLYQILSLCNQPGVYEQWLSTLMPTKMTATTVTECNELKFIQHLTDIYQIFIPQMQKMSNFELLSEIYIS